MHHVGLDVGYGFDDIPREVVRWVVDDVLGALARRTPVPAIALEATDTDLVRELSSGSPRVRGRVADLAAWLAGRSPGTGLAVDPDGAVPGAPIWI